MMVKIIHASGKRKRAVARATLKQGNGIIRINNFNLENYKPELAKLKIMEPISIAGEIAKKVNIDVNVFGGGWQSQAEASRLAIAKALAEVGGKKLRDEFLNYDRHLLVADVRRKEPYKPNDSKARAARQKSYR